LRCQPIRFIVTAVALATATLASSAELTAATEAVERGRHLVLIGHCNNCHTAGYVPANGNVSESRWLMGNPVGWRAKSGTIYASNLRLYVQNMSEQAWIQAMKTVEWRAPMPWWSVRELTTDELSAMYQYIRSLTPAGAPAPSFLPADREPPRPYNQLPDMS